MTSSSKRSRIHGTRRRRESMRSRRAASGRDGRQNQLVDELGGLDRAVAIAKQRAKIPADSEVEIVVYPARKSFYEILSDQFNGGSSDSMALSAWLNANLTGSEIEALRAVRGPLSMFRRGEILALMPYTYLR